MVGMSPSTRVRRIAPHAGTRLLQLCGAGHIGGESRRLSFHVRPFFEAVLVRVCDVEAHAEDPRSQRSGCAAVTRALHTAQGSSRTRSRRKETREVGSWFWRPA